MSARAQYIQLHVMSASAFTMHMPLHQPTNHSKYNLLLFISPPFNPFASFPSAFISPSARGTYYIFCQDVGSACCLMLFPIHDFIPSCCPNFVPLRSKLMRHPARQTRSQKVARSFLHQKGPRLVRAGRL